MMIRLADYELAVRVPFETFLQMVSDTSFVYLLEQDGEWFVLDAFDTFAESSIDVREKHLYIDGRRFITLSAREFVRFQKFASVRDQYRGSRTGLTKYQKKLIQGAMTYEKL